MKFKKSKQRDEIENFIKNHPGHLSADEIFKGLKAEGSTISLATVYRNLGILAQMNLINKIAHPRDGYVYDKSPNIHHHIFCEKCGTISDIAVVDDKELLERVSLENNIKINSYSITFWGICQNCNK